MTSLTASSPDVMNALSRTGGPPTRSKSANEYDTASPLASVAETVPTTAPDGVSASMRKVYESASNLGGLLGHAPIVSEAASDHSPVLSLNDVPSPYAPTLNSRVFPQRRSDTVKLVEVSPSLSGVHAVSPPWTLRRTSQPAAPEAALQDRLAPLSPD